MKPTLLFTISDLSGGGAEREIATLLSAVDLPRYSVHLALWRAVDVQSIPPTIPRTILHKSRPWHLPRTVARMRALIDEVRPDLVFSVLPYPTLVTGAALQLAAHRPRWVARFVSAPDFDIPRWLRLPMRRSLTRADALIACSRGVARATEQALRLPNGRIEVFDNPLDIDHLRAFALERPAHPDGAPALLVAGRLCPEKGIDRALRAFATVPAPAELWLLGDGPEREALTALAAQLGLAERVHFLGYQRAPHPWFARARALVVASRWEGFPNVIVEAMACGLPVVAFDCPFGPAELIEDGVSGRLIAADDVAGLAAAMREVLAEPERASGWARVAGDRIHARFGARRAIQRHLDLFAQLVDGPDGRTTRSN